MTFRLSSRAILLALLLLPAPAAWAADAEPVTAAQTAPIDRRGYSLFKPVPFNLMRELSTDRPDKTESPYTVDPGHFQLETDLAVFTQDRADGVRTRTWNFGLTNLKAGLLHNVDLQVVFGSYLNERVDDRGAGTRTRTTGVGDLTVRLKVNLWGNDGGKTAFGIMPYLKAPTASQGLGNEAFEGGLILPLALELPGGWSMGLMTQFDFLRNEDDRGYHTEFVNTITLGHDIVGKLGGYVEFFSSVSTEDRAPWVGTLDVGLTYALTPNVQLDAGMNIGVTRSADDAQPFVGISMRY